MRGLYRWRVRCCRVAHRIDNTATGTMGPAASRFVRDQPGRRAGPIDRRYACRRHTRRLLTKPSPSATSDSTTAARYGERVLLVMPKADLPSRGVEPFDRVHGVPSRFPRPL